MLMIGPLPPPYGGVANFTLNVIDQRQVRSLYEVRTSRTGGLDSNMSEMRQVSIDLARFLRFLFRREFRNAAIAHIHTSSYWSFLRNVPYVFSIRHFSGAKSILHLHSGKFKEFFEGSSPFVQKLVRRTLRSVDIVIVTSPSWIETIRKICGDDQAIYSVPNGFNPRIFHPVEKHLARERLGLPQDRKLMLAVGYLEEVKGHEHLIKALGEVLRYRDDVVLHIIGSGSKKKRLTELVQELGMGDHVVFVEERKTPEEISLWMSSSDIFVLSSLSEGNPTVMFECLGCGRPFIGTRVGGIPDIITSEEVGLLCNPADPEGLARCIMCALDKHWDQDFIQEYAQRYTWETIAGRLVSIYERALDRGTSTDLVDTAPVRFSER